MKRKTLNHLMLAGSAMVLAAGLSTLYAPEAAAQARSVPTFAADAGWPHVPPQWKLGDVSSIAINKVCSFR